MAVDTMGICQFLVLGPSGGVIRGSHFSDGGIPFPVYKEPGVKPQTSCQYTHLTSTLLLEFEPTL